MKMIWLFFFLISLPASGQDMRIEQIKAEKQKEMLLNQAKKKAEAAEKKAAMLHEKIVLDRALLHKAIKEMTEKKNNIQKSMESLESKLIVLREENSDLKETLFQLDAETKELNGFILLSIKDAGSLLKQSHHSALNSHRSKHFTSLEQKNKIPSMDDLKKMVDELFLEMKYSSEVKRIKGPIVDRKGREKDADLLILGNFTAMYQTEKESGFLIYSDRSERFFALSKLPSWEVRSKNNAYMKGRSEDVYLDISKGGALQKLTHELSLLDQIKNGGPIVWPILIILLLSLFIVTERLIFIFKIKIKIDPFMKSLSLCIAEKNWEGCHRLVQKHKTKLIPRILLKAIDYKDQSREDMENALQEAILSEIPRLERFISTLGMLAAIAPLLGLLGTVTGMINTFHVITYYGTSDPSLMSGGISEALVTTMLGLSVAIPIMLAHTLLSRKIENEIGRMEEKAVSFVNMIFKSKLVRSV